LIKDSHDRQFVYLHDILVQSTLKQKIKTDMDVLNTCRIFSALYHMKVTENHMQQ